MRQTVKWLATAASMGALLWQGPAQATFFGFPKALKPELERIQLSSPSLAPMSHVVFGLKCPADWSLLRRADEALRQPSTM